MGTQAAYSWIPSNARVVTLEGYGAIPRGSPTTTPRPLVWPAKDPTDTLDFVLDISEAVSGNEGDAIATLDVAISPDNAGDLLLLSSSADGDQAVMWFSQGVAGTIYAVTVTVGTNSGRVIGRTIGLPVVALAKPPISGEALTDQTGAPITDGLDEPITVTV